MYLLFFFQEEPENWNSIPNFPFPKCKCCSSFSSLLPNCSIALIVMVTTLYFLFLAGLLICMTRLPSANLSMSNKSTHKHPCIIFADERITFHEYKDELQFVAGHRCGTVSKSLKDVGSRMLGMDGQFGFFLQIFGNFWEHFFLYMSTSVRLNQTLDALVQNVVRQKLL